MSRKHQSCSALIFHGCWLGSSLPQFMFLSSLRKLPQVTEAFETCTTPFESPSSSLQSDCLACFSVYILGCGPVICSSLPFTSWTRYVDGHFLFTLTFGWNFSDRHTSPNWIGLPCCTQIPSLRLRQSCPQTDGRPSHRADSRCLSIDTWRLLISVSHIVVEHFTALVSPSFLTEKQLQFSSGADWTCCPGAPERLRLRVQAILRTLRLGEPWRHLCPLNSKVGGNVTAG